MWEGWPILSLRMPVLALSSNIQIKGPDSIILNTNSTKFLGLLLDNTLSWKAHITELVSKLTKACYAI